MNGAFAQAREGDAYPDAWYARDANGSKVRSVGFGNWLMDVTEPGWIDDRARTCERHVAAGLDGCMLDLLGTAPLLPGYATGIPIDARTQEAWRAKDWLAATSAIARAVQRTVRPAIVIGNGLGTGPRFFDAAAPSSVLLARRPRGDRRRVAPISEGGARCLSDRRRLVARYRDALERRTGWQDRPRGDEGVGAGNEAAEGSPARVRPRIVPPRDGRGCLLPLLLLTSIRSDPPASLVGSGHRPVDRVVRDRRRGLSTEVHPWPRPGQSVGGDPDGAARRGLRGSPGERPSGPRRCLLGAGSCCCACSGIDGAQAPRPARSRWYSASVASVVASHR